MNHIAPIHESAIRSIALDRLVIAPENVRKTPPDATAEAEMKASVATHGLMENLVVRSQGPDGDYAVVAGGRRLAALKALAADGVLDAAYPVPCLIVDGNAAPELLDAYRADNIDLETLKAFAVTTDHRRQMAVWAQLANQGYRPAPSQVKRLLTEDRIPATSAMARFVRVDAYEAAGGTVLRDLFVAEDENGIWFEDPALLNNLAMAKLGETVQDLATRWHWWATAMPEVDWTSIASCRRIYPEPAMSTRRRFTGEFKAKMARMKEVLTKGAERSRGDHEGEIRDLHAKIGELTVERDFLARAVKWSVGRGAGR